MSIKCGYCHQHHNSINEVRNCSDNPRPPVGIVLRGEAAEADYTVVLHTSATEQRGIIKGTPPRRDSIYTVVFDANTDDRITIRFYTPHSGRFAGVTLVKYLYGPNNLDDYTAVGTVVDGGVRIWLKHRGNERAKRAIKFLLNADEQQREQAGKTYALASGNCYVCGRTLTDPTSIQLGIGPICREG